MLSSSQSAGIEGRAHVAIDTIDDGAVNQYIDGIVKRMGRIDAGRFRRILLSIQRLNREELIPKQEFGSALSLYYLDK